MKGMRPKKDGTRETGRLRLWPQKDQCGEEAGWRAAPNDRFNGGGGGSGDWLEVELGAERTRRGGR